MVDHERIKYVIGLADCCELLGSLWSFPSSHLAEALCDGSFAADVQSCAADAGAETQDAEEIARMLAVCIGTDADELFESLRREYTRLFLIPGTDVPVFPYEGGFRHALSGSDGAPALFRSPVALSVESSMKEAGVITKNSRKEPCDSVWNEFAFLSYAFGSLAAALHRGDAEEENLWQERINRFFDEHVRVWIPAFMNQVCFVADTLDIKGPYATFAAMSQSLILLFDANILVEK